MKGAFECTVIDLPRHVLVQHPHLMQEVHVAVVVADLTLASTRDTIRILSWLKSTAPGSRVIVVANRVAPAGQTEVSQKDFETSIERKVDIVVMFDPKLAAQAAKLGKPLAEVSKNAKPGLQLAQLASHVMASVDDGDTPTQAIAGAKSLLSKLTDIKARLPIRKPKAAKA